MLLLSLALLDFGIIGFIVALFIGLFLLAKKYTWTKILTEIEETIIDIEEAYQSMPGKDKLHMAVNRIVNQLAQKSLIFKILQRILINYNPQMIIDAIQEIVARLNRFAKQKEQD